ncbi:hypothetical protein [Cellulosimicrobium protaetiae]|uniref:Uncharacterized protein n=1 Tax=Cellulosimicrobium protaetiae TaxID=2587808 RepID=A0A6M5UB34_9MICO|nr:hypothetical protein [Cellulosimicrobium protaetiae]QJW35460.1 hypothetical protein FIC82_003825 [Cellulosimicrobium protaetiae]
MNVVTRTPHDQVLARLRAADLEHGRVGPTDERGWTFAEVDTEPSTDERPAPASVAEALARVDGLVAAPWVVQLDAGSDELPDGVSAILAARPDHVAAPVAVTWVPLDPGGTDHTMRLDGDPAGVLAAVAALVGLRDATSAPDRLRELDHPDDLLDAFVEVAHLPTTDSAAPDAVVQLVRSDAGFVRAVVRRASSAWVRATDERTTVWATSRPSPPVPGSTDERVLDEFTAALAGEFRARSTIERGLRPGEAVVGIERAGTAVSWTVVTPGRPWAYGVWDDGWTDLSTSGSEGAYEALVEAFGEPRDPARLRALLTASTWPGDPVAELAYLLGLPSALVEAVGDPERFRHGAERVQPLGPTAPLTAAERAAVEARAPRRATGKTARDVVLLVLGLVLLGLGTVTFMTDGAVVGQDGSPGWEIVAWVAGGVLALAGWAGLGSARSDRRRFLDL